MPKVPRLPPQSKYIRPVRTTYCPRHGQDQGHHRRRHQIVRQALRQTLGRHDDIEVVGEAGLAADAPRGITALSPSVAVVDGRLPDSSGIEVCREIRSDYPHIALLILTSFDDAEALLSATLAGADGYVIKEIRGTNLVGAIRTVAAGTSLLSPSIVQRVSARLREGPNQEPALVELNTREREVLGLIAESLTNRQIATRLQLPEQTIRNYVSSILGKLGLASRTQNSRPVV